jgi:predicted nucleic acid-binding protein
VILADTSIWVEHLRTGRVGLTGELEQGTVLIHPFVIGELACGQLSNRAEVLDLLKRMPQVPTATDQEALEFIERRALMGRGIGYVDVHLLAATALSHGLRLWTRDRRLAALADEMGLAFVKSG